MQDVCRVSVVTSETEYKSGLMLAKICLVENKPILATFLTLPNVGTEQGTQKLEGKHLGCAVISAQVKTLSALALRIRLGRNSSLLG